METWVLVDSVIQNGLQILPFAHFSLRANQIRCSLIQMHANRTSISRGVGNAG